jgi:hypothetical protein
VRWLACLPLPGSRTGKHMARAFSHRVRGSKKCRSQKCRSRFTSGFNFRQQFRFGGTGRINGDLYPCAGVKVCLPPIAAGLSSSKCGVVDERLSACSHIHAGIGLHYTSLVNLHFRNDKYMRRRVLFHWHVSCFCVRQTSWRTIQ